MLYPTHLSLRQWNTDPTGPHYSLLKAMYPASTIHNTRYTQLCCQIHIYSPPLVLNTSMENLVHCSWSCVRVWPSGRIVSVTAGMNFLIWGMMMGYDRGMIAAVSTFWYCLVSIPDAQTKNVWFRRKISCHKDRELNTQQQTYIVPLYPSSHSTKVCWLTANRC